MPWYVWVMAAIEFLLILAVFGLNHWTRGVNGEIEKLRAELEDLRARP